MHHLPPHLHLPLLSPPFISIVSPLHLHCLPLSLLSPLLLLSLPLAVSTHSTLQENTHRSGRQVLSCHHPHHLSPPGHPTSWGGHCHHSIHHLPHEQLLMRLKADGVEVVVMIADGGLAIIMEQWQWCLVVGIVMAPPLSGFPCPSAFVICPSVPLSSHIHPVSSCSQQWWSV